MDIAHEVGVPGVQLLCASPVEAWVGADYGPSVYPSTCIAYAVLQRFEPSMLARDCYKTLQPNSVLLSKLAVAPALRRKGVGRALLAAAIATGRSVRARTCTLHVDETNARALGLYRSMGFEVTRRCVDFYRSGRHALEMELSLDVGSDAQDSSLYCFDVGAPPSADEVT